MNDDLDKYIEYAIRNGATNAKQIQPGSVVTAPWVRLKCQYGCSGFGSSFCCPPNTPTPEETRKILDSYKRAVLFHLELPRMQGRGKRFDDFVAMLTDLEGEIFKDGYYKAFVFLAGPCTLCKECSKLTNSLCNFGERARPAMEACGIDVFQTVRNNGFFIQTLRDKSETRNLYCLMLVD
ncbi:MAG: DUF2284 domain-containing protein [Syntrophales bacterium]